MPAPATVIRPTYDQDHYRARAKQYARDAEHELDVTIRETLQTLARECRRKADEIAR